MSLRVSNWIAVAIKYWSPQSGNLFTGSVVQFMSIFLIVIDSFQIAAHLLRERFETRQAEGFVTPRRVSRGHGSVKIFFSYATLSRRVSRSIGGL